MSTTSQEHVATSASAEDRSLGLRTSGTARSARGRCSMTRRLPRWFARGARTRLPIENDILIVKDQTSDNNQVAQEFYDSPLWPKFRFWEWFTWICNGGERRARNQVLQAPSHARRVWTCWTWRSATASISTGCRPTGGSSGVDISRSQLEACRRRAAGRNGLAGAVRSRGAPAREPPIRRRPEHRRLQLLQRSRGRAA